MANFIIKAVNDKGEVFKKELFAHSVDEARKTLLNEGLHIVSLKEKSAGLSLFSFTRKIDISEIIIFNKSLMSLLKSGMQLPNALKILSESVEDVILQKALKETYEEVEKGEVFSKALKKNETLFTPLYISTIASGEKTGDLQSVLSNYIKFVKKMSDVKKKVKSASMYPMFIIAVVIAISLGLILFVVPTFAAIYSDTNMELPFMTNVMIKTSDFVLNNILIFMALLAVIVFAFLKWVKSVGGVKAMDKFKLKMPRIGKIFLSYGLGKFSRTMSMILDSGIPLASSFEMLRGVTGNSLLEEKVLQIEKNITEGKSFGASLEACDFFPSVALNMVKVGERAATLPSVLMDIADYFDDYVDTNLTILTELIEPVLLVIMGLFVGAVVILMYLPIFQLGSAF